MRHLLIIVWCIALCTTWNAVITAAAPQQLYATDTETQQLFTLSTGLNEKPGTGYEKILKYERLVDIHLHRAIDSLAKKRAAEKNNNSQNDLPYLRY